MSTKLTLDELIAKLPDAYKPWATQFGPAFLAMTSDEVMAWLNKVVRGDVLTAYKDVLAKLPNADLLNEWDTINAGWQAANDKYADRIALQKSAAVAIVKILLAIALAAAGF